jgi:molybdopterin synthase catalytic subunit
MRVLFFARARDLAGVPAIEIALPAGATVGALRRRLAGDFPRLAGLLPECAIAVDEEFAEDDRGLSPEAEVAVLPPVSGGSPVFL